MTSHDTEAPDLFEASRRRLLSLAYRMLGSIGEAEDVVQETWLRWHEADRQVLKTPAAWLTTVATRLCLDRLRRLQRERTVIGAGWLPEPWFEEIAPSPEDDLSLASELSYGVLLMLERLTPEERAALLLHEVFDCPYDEIARALDRNAAHCRQIVKRAKERVRAGRRRRPVGAQASQALVQQFLDAIRQQDKQALMQLLTEEPVLVTERGPRAGAMKCAQASAAILAFFKPLLHPRRTGLASINRNWGLQFMRSGVVELAVSFDFDGDRIDRVYAVAVPARPTRLQSSFHPLLLSCP